MSQILFLFDLDQCLPLTNASLTSENLEFLIARLRRVCLQLLLSHSAQNAHVSSSIVVSNDALKNRSKFEHQHMAHFDFRFYSSNEYFMVPDQLQPTFSELEEESLDKLETSLSERFEQLLQNSKTNTFNADALKQHIESVGHKSHSQTLRKALEEIAVLYTWDNPMLNSPVKQMRGISRSRIPSKFYNDENIVYIFTCLPNNSSELARFLGKSDKSSKRFNYKDIFEELFNQTNKTGTSQKHISNKKSIIISSFKNPDAPIRLSVIDTAPLFQKHQYQNNKYDRSIKSSFNKCFRQFDGHVISFSCFSSDNGFISSSGDSDLTKRRLQFSVPISSILKNYRQEVTDATRRGSLEKFVKDKICKLKLPNPTADKYNEHSDLDLIDLHWLPIKKSVPSDQNNASENWSESSKPQDNENLLTGKVLRTIACVSNDMIPRDQRWTNHYLLWPFKTSNSSCDISVTQHLFQYLLRNQKVLLIQLETDDENMGNNSEVMCAIHPFNGKSAILSIIDQNESNIYSIVVELNHSETVMSKQIELSTDMKNLIEDIFKKCEPNTFQKCPRKVGNEDIPVNYFQGSSFEHWKVPECARFSSIATKLKGKNKSIGETRAERFKNLQKCCLPKSLKNSSSKTFTTGKIIGNKFHVNDCKGKLLERRLTQRSKISDTNTTFSRLVSDESGISSLNGPNLAKGRKEKKSLSRGECLLNLGMQNQELRKNSRDDKLGTTSNTHKQNTDPEADAFNLEKQPRLEVLENQLVSIYEKTSPEWGNNDVNPLIHKLQQLQVSHIIRSDDISLLCLAEVTVRYIANLVRYLNSNRKDRTTSVEDILNENFLLDPSAMQESASSSVRKQLWDNEGARIRDHKLQVLYRVDVHWILSSQEKQNEIEKEILVHLRQIQLWDSVSAMALFLNNILTPNYLAKSSDLLTLLYEEQGQKRPKELEMLFSPTKSDTTSVAPSSVMSRTSEISYRSVPSLKLKPNSGVQVAPNISEMEKRKKLRRNTSFDTQSLQINMLDKKNLGRAAQLSAVGYAIGTTKVQSINQPRIHTRGEQTKISNSTRAKRNLSFDDPKLGANSTSSSGLRRSPRKRVTTSDMMSNSPVTSRRDVKGTPSKKDLRKKSLLTPCKMTPGKSHHLYAPETPKNKRNNRRKTDGVAFVDESPDMDQIKAVRGEKTTPRRIAASLNLRKKTSFYSSNVSRNLMKAEELMNATQIQSFSMPQHNQSERMRKGSLGQHNQNDDSGGKFDTNRRDSCGLLFPHLVQTSKMQDIVENMAKTTEPKKSSDLRKDSGCPSDLMSNVESVGTLPSRKLNGDALLTVNSEVTPPKTMMEIRKIALTPVISKNGRFDDRHIHPAFAKGNDILSSSSRKSRSNTLDPNQANSSGLSYEEPLGPQTTKFQRDEQAPTETKPLNASKGVINKNGSFDGKHSHPAFAKGNYILSSSGSKRGSNKANSSCLSYEEPLGPQTTEFQRDEQATPEHKPLNTSEGELMPNSENNFTNKQLQTKLSSGENVEQPVFVSVEHVHQDKLLHLSNDSDGEYLLSPLDPFALSESTKDIQPHKLQKHGSIFSAGNVSLPKCDTEPKKLTWKHDTRIEESQGTKSIRNTSSDEGTPDNSSSSVELRHHASIISNEKILSIEKGKENFDLNIYRNQTDAVRKISNQKLQTPERPSRKRKLTTRMGIDDITLNEVICCRSPKTRITPKHKYLKAYKESVVLLKKHPIPPQPQTMYVTSANDAPEMLDNYSPIIPSAKRRKIAKKLSLTPSKSNSICKTKTKQKKGRNQKEINMYSPTSSSKASELCTEASVSHDSSPGSPKNFNESNTNITAEGDAVVMNSPGKFWSIVSRTASPQGVLTLSLNRRKKPQVS